MPFLIPIVSILGLIALAFLFDEAKDHLDRSTEDEAFNYLNQIKKKKRELFEKLCAEKDSLPENARKNINNFLLEYKQ